MTNSYANLNSSNFSNEINDEYNPKSCNLSEKESYTPIEAAIRWCGLSQYEQRILERTGSGIPGSNEFPQWPCLRINLLKIRSAISDNTIEYALGGIVPQQNWYPYPSVVASHLAQGTLTIHRNVLKFWIAENYPDQKPAFLFDEIERKTHAAINADSFRALQIDRDSLKVRLDDGISKYHNLEKTCDELLKKNSDLEAKISLTKTPGERSERTYQNIIVTLLDCILGDMPGVDKHQGIKNQSSLINLIVEKYREYEGLSETTLKKKFPEAKENFKNQ